MEQEKVYGKDTAHASEHQPVLTPRVPWTMCPGQVPDTFVTDMIERHLKLVYDVAYNRTYNSLSGEAIYFTRMLLADACRREVSHAWKAAGRDPVDLVTRSSLDKRSEGAARAEQDYQAALDKANAEKCVGEHSA